MSKRIYARIHGKVQGVGFRFFVLCVAERLSLHGWVRNLPEETQVELEAEGEDGAVEQLVASLRQGPRGAWVRSVQVEERMPMDAGGGFQVR